ncbi:MAG: orotidine 5'-phosphate decarboxylase / HUMPS family protein [Acidilobaceae archaeon]
MSGSRLIVALDPKEKTSLGSFLSVIPRLCEEVYGLKIGLPFLVLYGIHGLSLVRNRCKARLIADFKLADVAHVMIRSIEPIAELVDVVIAHSFVGARGALQELKEFLDARGIDLALVISMSHLGSEEVIDESFGRIVSVAERLRPWGAVAPATRPHMIKLVKSRLSAVKILSPGVGLQGARPGDALKAGSDYEIVGRLIWESADPLETVRLINLEHKKVLGESY